MITLRTSASSDDFGDNSVLDRAREMDQGNEKDKYSGAEVALYLSSIDCHLLIIRSVKETKKLLLRAVSAFILTLTMILLTIISCRLPGHHQWWLQHPRVLAALRLSPVHSHNLN